jgi:4a-hydroxytetrahydrobiopterin dehydratase
MPTAKLTRTEQQQNLTTLDRWTLDEVRACIFKEWRFESFAQAMVFLNQVADLAERLDHHPEMVSNHTRLRISLTTHDAGGLTHKDFDMAQTLDQMAKLLGVPA